MVLGRYENCGLPDGAALALFIVTLLLALTSVSYGSYIFFYRAARRSKLWLACGTAVASSCCFILALVSLIAEDFSMPWYGALFTDFGSVLSVHLAGRILLSVLGPVAASQHIKTVWIHNLLFVWVLPGFMFVFLLIALIYGYTTGEIATGMAFVFLTIGVGALVALPFLYWFPTMLIRALTDSMRAGGGLVQDNAGRGGSTHLLHSPEKLTKLLLKVQIMRFTSCFSCAVVVLMCFLASIIHLRFDTLPFSWCFFYAFVGGLSMFHLQSAHFAKPALSGSSSTNRSRQLSKLAMNNHTVASEFATVDVTGSPKMATDRQGSKLAARGSMMMMVVDTSPHTSN